LLILFAIKWKIMHRDVYSRCKVSPLYAVDNLKLMLIKTAKMLITRLKLLKTELLLKK